MKLSNGLDVICKNLNIVDGLYIMEKAVAIHISQNKDGSPSMGFLPLTFFSVDAKEGMNVEIDKHHVLFQYTPNNDIVAGYIQFSSGLAVPKKSSIIT